MIKDEESRPFTFNCDNKQAEVRGQSNELIGEYFYDGEGRRVKKHRYVGGVLTEVTVFVYSAGKLAAEARHSLGEARENDGEAELRRSAIR